MPFNNIHDDLLAYSSVTGHSQCLDIVVTINRGIHIIKTICATSSCHAVSWGFRSYVVFSSLCLLCSPWPWFPREYLDYPASFLLSHSLQQQDCCYWAFLRSCCTLEPSWHPALKTLMSLPLICSIRSVERRVFLNIHLTSRRTPHLYQVVCVHVLLSSCS